MTMTKWMCVSCDNIMTVMSQDFGMKILPKCDCGNNIFKYIGGLDK